MTTTARLERTAFQLAAGGVEQVPLRIRNDGDVVEAYSIEVLGVPGAWTSVEPAEITGLFPGTETTATISFAPPRSATVPAGQLSFGVRVVPQEHPEQSVVPEGTVEILPFLETTAELVPRTSRGRRGATHHIAVDNRGNVPVTVRLDAPDQDALRVEARPPALTVPPGEAAFADLRVTPRTRIWRGASVTHPFALTVHADETTPVTLEGTHLQEQILPPWFLKALLALLGLLLLLTALWFLVLRPAIVTTAQRAVEEDVAAATEAAQEAAVAAQEASEQAGQASTAAQAAQGAAGDAGAAAVEANALVGSPVLDDLVVPVADRFQASTPLGATTSPPTFVVPDNGTLRLTDFVLSNPQGDFGRVQVTLDNRTILDLALENFRSVDYHFQEAIVAGEGAELTMTVRCDEVGVPPAQNPAPTTCDTSVFYGGTLLQPVED